MRFVQREVLPQPKNDSTYLYNGKQIGEIISGITSNSFLLCDQKRKARTLRFFNTPKFINFCHPLKEYSVVAICAILLIFQCL